MDSPARCRRPMRGHFPSGLRTRSSTNKFHTLDDVAKRWEGGRGEEKWGPLFSTSTHAHTTREYKHYSPLWSIHARCDGRGGRRLKGRGLSVGWRGEDRHVVMMLLLLMGMMHLEHLGWRRTTVNWCTHMQHVHCDGGGFEMIWVTWNRGKFVRTEGKLR